MGTSVELVGGAEKVCTDKFASSRVLLIDGEAWVKDYQSYLQSLLKASSDMQLLFKDPGLAFETMPLSFENVGLREELAQCSQEVEDSFGLLAQLNYKLEYQMERNQDMSDYIQRNLKLMLQSPKSFVDFAMLRDEKMPTIAELSD